MATALLTNSGNRLAVTDTGCNGQLLWTADGGQWEQVEPGEWWNPATDDTARPA